MEYYRALKIAQNVKEILAPHCHRIEIAGSIRRKKPEVKDIEIVAIPKPYETGLFASGIAPVVDQWPKSLGQLPCRYTQRILPQGINLDLFLCEFNNWGYILAIRTGSADFVKMLASKWKEKGYKGIRGKLTYQGKVIGVSEERQLFTRLGVPFLEPENRNL